MTYEELKDEIIESGVDNSQDPQVEKQFYTDDVIQEIIDKINGSPVYADDIDSAVADYWADYPWSLEADVISELEAIGKESDELTVHNTLLACYAEIRIVRKQGTDYNVRSIVRGILEGVE